MEVTAITRNARMSAAKGRPLARECRGLPVSAALKVVEFSPKKAAVILKKTLLSAAANAKNNNGLDTATLTVKECVFDESVRIRRFWPTARGSAHPIARRLCLQEMQERANGPCWRNRASNPSPSSPPQDRPAYADTLPESDTTCRRPR